MGVSVRRTCRVEGCRDETRTIKTNSPRPAENTKEKPAGLKRRAWGLHRRSERGMISSVAAVGGVFAIPKHVVVVARLIW